jgi:hypothetical protein
VGRERNVTQLGAGFDPVEACRQTRMGLYPSGQMTDVSELETARLASTFRPNRRPLQIAVLANGVMALLLLGVPYFRGRSLAAEERREFGQFARCLIGGEPTTNPGLSLPRGDREHFAAKVLFAKPSWPLACRPALHSLAPPEAFFLWPAVKQAGEDMRAAVAMVERELVQLDASRKRGPGRVPARPLEALKRLQAATVLFAQAAGVDADLDNDVLRFVQPAAGLATPARLPLMAGNGTLEVWSAGATLEALALDGRGISYVRVADGKIDRDRLRRTSFLRGVLRAGATPYLVWAMPDARCSDREDHCAGRPTGLAPYQRGATALSEPTWKLSGHPAGRIDRVMQVSELGRVDLLARATAAGGLELLMFRLPSDSAPGGTDHKTVLLEPSANYPVRSEGAAVSALLLPGEPSAALYASDGEAGVSATLAWASEDAKPLPLPAANGVGAWTTGCTLGDARYLVYGSTSQLRIVRAYPPVPAAPDPATAPAAQQAGIEDISLHDVALNMPLDGDNPAFDEVRVFCAAEHVHVLFTNREHALQQIACDAQGCGPLQEIARDVTGYSAVSAGEDLVVAFAAPLIGSVVRVTRLNREGRVTAQASTPAACWEPLGGMCGTPTLIRDEQRLVLAARDGADLLALESTDQGRTFSTLSGLVVGTGFETSTTSPLQQHRLKKGLQ